LTALSGASPRRRRDLIRYGAYALFALVVLGVAGSAARELQYEWDWATFFGKWLTLLLKGLVLTLEVASVALLMALPLGTVVGLCRIARDPVAKWVGTIYVELVRGTPLLVQLMIWYFVLSGPLGLPAFWAGTIGLACFTASYIAEIVRAGIQSIDRGQMEAARSLGLTHLQALRFVILPQAFRRVLPPLASEFIALVKDSSLLSVIGIEEMTKRAYDIQGRSFLTFEVWTITASLYLAICLPLSLGIRWLGHKLGTVRDDEAIR